MAEELIAWRGIICKQLPPGPPRDRKAGALHNNSVSHANHATPSGAKTRTMAISADISDPLDDTKGGDSLWGHWQQDKKEQVVLTLHVPAAAKARNIQVLFKTGTIKVVVVGETRMDDALCGKVRGPARPPATTHRRWRDALATALDVRLA